MHTAQEILKDIRINDFNNASQQKFAELLNVKRSSIQNVESGTQKAMPYDIAESLHYKYGYSIPYVMSGKGPKYIEKKYTLEPRIAIDDDLKYKRRNYGQNIEYLRKIANYSIARMSKIGGVEEDEYLNIVANSPEPDFSFIENIIANFNTSLDELLYDTNGSFKEALEAQKKGDELQNIDFENLSPEVKNQIKALLKGASNTSL